MQDYLHNFRLMYIIAAFSFNYRNKIDTQVVTHK